MGIKTVPQPPYSPELAPCDFWLFPKLRGCRYETIEEMKEAVTKVIDTHETLVPFVVISSGCNALVVPFQQLLEGLMEVLLCERVNDLPSLNLSCHSKTDARLMQDSPKAV